MGTRLLLGLMRVLVYLPLAWVRALGWVLGRILHAVVSSRRRVVQVNLRQCFPALNDAQVRALTHRVFVRFA